jgi:hypothetical protein
MTMAEATEIADNALEHSVRCILQAVQVGALGGNRVALCVTVLHQRKAATAIIWAPCAGCLV